MTHNTLALQGLLITRQSAKQYRNRMVNLLDEHASVTVDLSAVELLTPSFADECFGVLGQMYGPKIFRTRLKLTGITDDVKHLISVVLANRLKNRAKPQDDRSVS